MTRAAQAALALALALAGNVLAGAGPAQAATLGATFGPTTVYGSDREPYVVVLNRSDVPAAVSLEADTGWQLAESAFTLAPQEMRQVPVSTVGTGDGRAWLSLSEAGQVVAAGQQANALLLSVRLVMIRPFDWAPVVFGAVAALVALALLVLAMRRWRPWELRLARQRGQA